MFLTSFEVYQMQSLFLKLKGRKDRTNYVIVQHIYVKNDACSDETIDSDFN